MTTTAIYFDVLQRECEIAARMWAAPVSTAS